MIDQIEVDADLTDLFDSVFGEYAAASGGGGKPVVFDRTLWVRLEELGLTRLTGAEEDGGSGAGWAEAAALVSAAAKFGVRAPLGEHDLLAEWLRAELAIEGEPAVRTVAVLDQGGRATGVPWASAVDRLVLVWPQGDTYRAVDAAPGDVEIVAGVNGIGEPRDTVSADTDSFSGVEVSLELIEQLRMRSALLRAIQLCAVLDRALELAIEHTTTRVQFGRPIAKFQAIQTSLADIAGECALARAATETALLRAITTDWTADDLAFLIAVARSCAGHAASVVVRGTHQVHGAIGTTIEHPLHQSTRAALAWRSEYGSLASWDTRLTDAAISAGPHGLWRLIAG